MSCGCFFLKAVMYPEKFSFVQVFVVAVLLGFVFSFSKQTNNQTTNPRTEKPSLLPGATDAQVIAALNSQGVL